MQITEMIDTTYPELQKDINEQHKALQTTKEWLSENIISEDPKVAALIIAKSNQETRLIASIAELERKYQVNYSQAQALWNHHNQSKHSADGLKGFTDALKAIDKIKKDVPGLLDFKRSLTNAITTRESVINQYKELNENSPFNNVLSDIKAS